MAAPHATCNHHFVSRNRAIGGFDASGFTLVSQNARDFDIFKHLTAFLTCARRKCLCDIDRIDLAVLGQKYTALYPVQIVMGNASLDFFQRNDINFQPKILGHGCAAQQFLIAALVQRKRNGSILFEAGGLAGFFFQTLKKTCRVFSHFCQIARSPQLAHQSSSVPGRAGG